MKKILGATLGYGVVIAILVAVISALAIFGGTIMKLFGFEYESVKSLILFFVIVGVVGFPLEILVKAIPKAMFSVGKIGKKGGMLLLAMLDTISTVWVMAVVDYFIESVSATKMSIVVIAVIMAILDAKDFGKES